MFGYKVIAYDPDIGGFSLSLCGDKRIHISTEPGSVVRMPRDPGFFLGSTKQYVLDYYSCLTNGNELLLTYQFDKGDIINNFINMDACAGEIIVRRCKLLAVECIIKCQDGCCVKGIGKF